jgi:hypothetical protein
VGCGIAACESIMIEDGRGGRKAKNSTFLERPCSLEFDEQIRPGCRWSRERERERKKVGVDQADKLYFRFKS